MAQFEVYANPIAAARSAYPLVIVLPSEFTAGGHDTIVAPLAPRAAMGRVTGRLVPLLTVGAIDYAVIVPALTSVRARDLQTPVHSAARSRADLLAAIDYLFFGV